MEKFVFKPWKGNRFHETRLLLLSESAYSWTEDKIEYEPSPNHPTECVEWAIEKFDTVLPNSYFGKVTRALCNKANPSRDDRMRAWHEYAYSIYVPGSVGYGAGTRPTSEMLDAGKPLFRKLIAELQPQKIIVTGFDAWHGMPDCEVMLARDVQAYEIPTGTLAWCLALPHTANRTEGFAWEAVAKQIALFRRLPFPQKL